MAKVGARTRFQIWYDVIVALLIRSIRSDYNDKLGISWAVLQPLAFIFILSYIRGRMNGTETHTMPTFVFIVYGIVCLQFFVTTLNATARSLNKNKPLFAFRQVMPVSSFFAAAALEYIVKVVVIISLIVIMYFLNIELQVNDVILVITNFTLIWLIAFSLGILFAILAAYLPESEKFRVLAQRPLIFISGVFFSLQDIPREFWGYLDWNPLLHAIELSRQAAYPSFGAVGVSFNYLVGVALVSFFLALIVYNNKWKQAISR